MCFFLLRLWPWQCVQAQCVYQFPLFCQEVEERVVTVDTSTTWTQNGHGFCDFCCFFLLYANGFAELGWFGLLPHRSRSPPCSIANTSQTTVRRWGWNCQMFHFNSRKLLIKDEFVGVHFSWYISDWWLSLSSMTSLTPLLFVPVIHHSLTTSGHSSCKSRCYNWPLHKLLRVE